MQKANFTPELIAPCGMNCGICKSYLAYSIGIPKKKGKVSHCPGCIPRNKNCYISGDVENFEEKNESCVEIDSMSCENLDRLDRRYRSRYNMSMVESLGEIREQGMENFLEKQEKKYRCSECGDVVSVHDGKCYTCLRG